MKMVWHWILIILAFAIVFVWTETSLSDYTLQALAVLVIVYILISVIRKKRNPQSSQFGSSSDIFILIISILLLVNYTGNLYSPLFFLLYFLGFGITFIFEPIAVFVFALGAITVFLPQAFKNGSIESFLRIGSIILIAPLAFFFGQQYKDRDKEEEQMEQMRERSKEAGETIEKDVEEVLENEKNLKPEDKDKLDEVVNEAEDLREEAEETNNQII